MAALTIVGDPANGPSLSRQAFEVATLMGTWSTVSYSADVPADGFVFIAQGDADARSSALRVVDRDRLVTLVHPMAAVSPSATVGRNVCIGAQAVVMMDAVVGDGVTASTLSAIEHDNRIGDFTFLGTGANLCGHVTTGDFAFIGGGAVVQPGITIGERCTVGTGAVVIRDAEASTTLVGNPAKPIG